MGKEITKKKRGNPNIKDHAAKGGAKKKGKKMIKTIVREEAMKIVEQGIYGNATALFNAQMHLAVGKYTRLFFMGSPIKDQDTIDWYMWAKWEKENERELDEEDEKKFKDYQLVTIHNPDNAAIKDLLDRGLGKATNKVEISGELTGMSALADAMDRASAVRLAIAQDEKERIEKEKATYIESKAKDIKPEKAVQKPVISKKNPIYLSAMNIEGLKKEALKYKIKITGKEKKQELINLITKAL